MMNQEINKIHDKINKLLKLQKGAEEIGSMEEAANAASKIQKLVLEYNIDINKLNPEKIKDMIIVQRWKITKEHGFKKTESDWLLKLFFCITKHNMCEGLVHNNKGMGKDGVILVTIIGEQNNIDLVQFIFTQISYVVRKMRIKAFNKALDSEPWLRKNAYYRAYSRSFVSALDLKFWEETAKTKAEVKGSTELMVINDKAVQEKMQQTFKNITPLGKSRDLGSYSGHRDGRKDGSTTDINKGLN